MAASVMAKQPREEQVPCTIRYEPVAPRARAKAVGKPGAGAVRLRSGAGRALGAVEGVGKARVEGEVMRRVRVHQRRGYGVEPLGGLAVALLALRAELAGPPAARTG